MPHTPDAVPMTLPPTCRYLLLATAVMLSGCTTVDRVAQPDLIVPYKQIDGLTLNLHVFLPAGAGDQQADAKPRPVLLWFHGGGWRRGQPGQFYRQSGYFADRGLVCIAAEYRLTLAHGTTPFDAARDAFDAMRFVRTHAAAWKGDPNRIAAGGGSAGGHLAAGLATLTAEDLAGAPRDAERARPDLLILYNPVFDNGPVDGYGHDRLGARWREMSPAHNLHAGVPPTLVMLGDQDRLLPVATVERFTSRLDALGVANRAVVYPGAGHGFFNHDGREGKYYFRTRTEVERFLIERGWLTAAEGTRSAEPATMRSN